MARETEVVNKPIRVLLVEDDEDDYFLTRELFNEMNGGYVLDWVSDYDSGLEAMRRGEHDVCLLDYRLGRKTGLDLLRQASREGVAAPAILLTGQGEREIDLEAAEAGISDYLEKAHLDATLLERSIRYARERWRNRIELERRVAERTAELQRTNEALRESEERLRLAVESADIGTWDYNPQTGELQWSDRCKTMFGVPLTSKMNYELFMARVHPEDRDAVANAVRTALDPNGDGRYEIEMRSVWPDGAMRRLMAKGQAFFAGDGLERCAVRFIGAVRDMTREREAQERIQSLVEELQQADRRKDDFLAVLAHELRNPLAPVRTGLEVMKLASGDVAMIEEVRATMERQVDQLVRLVDDLLEVSRITRGKMELRKRDVQLSEIVQLAVEASEPFIREAGHRLSVSMPSQSIHLYADPHRLAQVLSNLLNNAAKYTPEGGHIWINAVVEGARVAVTVKDTGLGIPHDLQDRIFEMFAQLDRSVEKGYRGLGIGLTLVKSLVEMHGGKVSVHSEGPGCGSEFTVWLDMLSHPANTCAAETSEKPSAPATKRRILVVDDNRAAADMLTRVIEILGHEVCTAYEGAHAIDLGAEFRPDLAFLDLGMPDLNGYELAKRARQEPWGKKAVLVALTGWGQEEDRRRTKEAGFDYHLVKPVEPAAIQNLLDGINQNRVRQG